MNPSEMKDKGWETHFGQEEEMNVVAVKATEKRFSYLLLLNLDRQKELLELLWVTERKLVTWKKLLG